MRFLSSNCLIFERWSSVKPSLHHCHVSFADLIAFCSVPTTGTEDTGGRFAFVFDLTGDFVDLLYRLGTARAGRIRSAMVKAPAAEAQVRSCARSEERGYSMANDVLYV